MSPTSERLLPRPSVEARVQLDCVELLCVPAEPIPGCQRGLVQDGVPVVVAPSRRTNPDVTHSSPIPGFCPPSHAEDDLPTSTSSSLPIDRPPVAASRPPDNKALTARAHSTNRPSRVRTTQLRELSCRRRTSGTRMPRTRARPNGSRCGGSGWQSSPRRDCTAHSSGIPMAPSPSGLIHP